MASQKDKKAKTKKPSWYDAVMKTLEESNSMLMLSIETIETAINENGFTAGMTDEGVATAINHIREVAAENTNKSKAIELLSLGLEVSVTYFALESSRKDEKDYARKKKNVRNFNSILRTSAAAIAHKETGEPCILYAVTNHDGSGRYTLENRITKKRSGSYKSILDLLPIKLVSDIPRKEGVIERRKSPVVTQEPARGTQATTRVEYYPLNSPEVKIIVEPFDFRKTLTEDFSNMKENKKSG